MRRTRCVVLFVAVVVFVAGCGRGTLLCTVDDDCPIGFICAFDHAPPYCIDVEWGTDAAGIEAGPGLDGGVGTDAATTDAGAFICTDPGDDDCTTDPFDPGNGGMGSATPIMLGVCYCGMGICSPDTDYYEFQLTSAGGLRAVLTFFQAEGDLDLDLYICRRSMGNCNATAIMSALSFTDNEVLEIPTGLIPGRYLLRVYSKFGFAYGNPDYCLQVDTL